MARTATRRGKKTSVTSKKNSPKVNFTTSADTRNVGNSNLIILSDDQKFVGYALFNPDPKLEDNPGYVEYGEHWDMQGNRFVPCWGEKNGCLFCKAGQQASQRALGAFLVTSINGEELEEPEIKLFRLNWTMLKEWIDELDEEGEILGKRVRIKCVSRSDGEYTTKFYDKDTLSKKDLKAATKDIPDLELIIQRNLDRALQAMRVTDILEEDDDDDDDEPVAKKKSSTKTSKKKKVEDDEDEDEDEDEEDEDEEDEEDDDDDEDNNDDDDDDEDDEDEDDEDEDDEDEDEEDEEDDEEDEPVKRGRGRPKGSTNKKKEDKKKKDDDEDEDEEDEDSDDEDEEEEDEVLEGIFTIVSTNESESTFTMKEMDSDLYFPSEILNDLDFDDYKKGEKVTLRAEKDEDSDWVATEFKKVKKTSTKTSTKKKK